MAPKLLTTVTVNPLSTNPTKWSNPLNNSLVIVLRISPYSVRMRENVEQKKLVFGHFLRSDYL